MKQMEMFKASLSRVLTFAKANPSHPATLLCARIGYDIPTHFLLSKVGQGSQEK
jgi:hypothetical protein